MTAAWISPREAAVERVHNHFHLNLSISATVVDLVLEAMRVPDRDMLEAGAAELRLALPKGTTAAYQRTLAGVIWAAMLQRVD